MTTASLARTIDVGGTAAEAAWERVREAFDALDAGESLVVVGDSDSRSLLVRLQAQRKGLFEWSPLESGPRFRTEITRRGSPAGARREVLEALAWDHDRLEAIEARAFEQLAAGDTPGARAAWAEFSLGLRRHIRFEEQILFPEFEQRVGLPADQGPTAVMRMEHREIERLIDAIGRALGGDGAPLPLRGDLHRVLGQHNMKEEHVLYPGADRCLSPDERDTLVARIQSS